MEPTTEQLLVFKVAELAKSYHAGQTRQDKTTPYITHPLEVMALLAYDGFGWILQCAALLHDVLEDCPITIPKMLIDMVNLGISLEDATRITTIVVGMTSPDKHYNVREQFKRAERKAMMRAHLETCGWEVAVVKVYDRHSNISDMNGFKEDFRQTYAKESLALGELLYKRLLVDPIPSKLKSKALDKAQEIITKSKRIIGNWYDN